MICRATISILALYKWDKDIFNEMLLPDALLQYKATIIDNILMQFAELETLYTDPGAMAQAIYIWSSRRLNVWGHLYETTQYEYNPIWNKDGTYKEIETRDLTSTGETINNVKGFNSDNWSDSDKTNSTGTDGGTITREHIEQGNIGVTTTQTMIKEEREIAEFNIIEYIINDFKNEFCLLIY